MFLKIRSPIEHVLAILIEKQKKNDFPFFTNMFLLPL